MAILGKNWYLLSMWLNCEWWQFSPYDTIVIIYFIIWKSSVFLQLLRLSVFRGRLFLYRVSGSHKSSSNFWNFVSSRLAKRTIFFLTLRRFLHLKTSFIQFYRELLKKLQPKTTLMHENFAVWNFRCQFNFAVQAKLRISWHFNFAVQAKIWILWYLISVQRSKNKTKHDAWLEFVHFLLQRQ